QRGLEALPPFWGIRRQSAEREIHRIPIEAPVDSSAAIEAALGIGIIVIVQYARDVETLVVVEGMFEHAADGDAGVHHEVLADEAAGIGQAFGETVGFRKQQQARGLGTIGTDHHGPGALQDLLAPTVEVDHSGHASIAAGLDLADVAIGADLATA